MSDRKALARELYDLERAHAARSLEGVQLARWQELAQLVFARAANDDRRMSSRISGMGKAKVKVGDKAATFDVVDVSWGGLSVKGRGAAKLADGAEAELLFVLVDDEWVSVPVSFRVVRRHGKGGAALRLVDLDTPRRRRFFEKAYYPMYLAHLKTLAELTG